MPIVGVSWNSANRRWRVTHDGYRGEYPTEEEATLARRLSEVVIDGYLHEQPRVEVVGEVGRVSLMARRGRIAAWATIDADMADVARMHAWCLSAAGYAVTKEPGGRDKGLLFLHRIVEPRGSVADHISGDKLDCRRANLRPCDQIDNSRNRNGWASSESGYKGVHRSTGGRWRARITVAGQEAHLGTYESKEDAARAYDRAAAEHFGEFARLNFGCLTGGKNTE